MTPTDKDRKAADAIVCMPALDLVERDGIDAVEKAIATAIAEARRETATACADQAVYRLGAFSTDEERAELRADILRAGGAL